MNEFSFVPLVEEERLEQPQDLLCSSFSTDVFLSEKPLFKEKENGFCINSFSPTISNNGKTFTLKSKMQEERICFEMNLNIWNNQTSLLANNNFDNLYFKEIVKMGEDAVPFILEELHKGPTPLVHALDLIYPGVVEYVGFIPLGAICSLWEDILMKKKNK